MADPTHPGPDQGHLDASGPREVVFCHECNNEWYRDEHGLVCPGCTGEITEIITPESDPRPIHNAPRTPPDIESLRNHNPWQDSDPEEADIEEHITRGPGNVVFITQTLRSGPRSRATGGVRGAPGADTPHEVMSEFQQMLTTLMGSGIRPGQAGRSGPDDLFPPSPFGGGPRAGGEGPARGAGPAIVGGRVTYTTGPFRPRNGDDPIDRGAVMDDFATYASPSPSARRGRSLLVVRIAAPPDQLASLIGTIFGQLAPLPGEDRRGGPGGMPLGLQGMFASLLNPANARHGDAVYSQEALDQIISTLMEQHPTSNAPGPAPPDAIAALPKKNLDENVLGPEGKGECSVCMDDVHIGDEVVVLPCNHWFHEQCASAWLSEHNTCPICRKGIDAGAVTADGTGSSQAEATAAPIQHEHRSRRSSQLTNTRDGTDRGSVSSRHEARLNFSRHEARLNSIRNAAGLPPEEPEARRRWHVVGEPSGNEAYDYAGQMPGAFRRLDSGMSAETQRDSRRRNTSGSDRSRGSRRSSQSGDGNGTGSGGAMGWIRDRFSRRS